MTFNGTPVTEGAVLLSNSTTGISAQAQIGGDGSYKITTPAGGIPPGEYKVTVTPPEVPAPGGNGQTEPGTVLKPVDNIPDKYRNPSTTSLTVSVQVGNNRFDISMEG